MNNIETIFIYSINNKNKVIGKLENISKSESLKNIRFKIKKMNIDDEFVKPINNNFDIFDKDMEEDFSLKDILIKENEVYKIYIKESNFAINIKEKNINKNTIIQNKYIIKNNNYLKKNSSVPALYNNNYMNNHVDIINMNNNNMNNMANMNNINNINNNVNNISNINNMNNIANMNNINLNNVPNMNNNINNMININNMNNMNNMANMNNINNYIMNNMANMMNNMNNINNININNNMNNFNIINNNCMDINSQNKIFNNFNNQMNDNIMIKYKVLFKTTNGINYTLNINGRKRMDNLISTYKENMLGKNLFIDNYLFFYYNGQPINEGIKTYVRDYFKNEKNPIIFVQDNNNMIGKLIPVTFNINQNGEKYDFIFNSKSYFSEIKDNIYDELGKGSMIDQYLYKGQQIIFEYINKTIGEFFNNDDRPIVFVNDINNVIGKKIKVNFETNHGYKHEIIINNRKLIEELLNEYFKEVDDNYIFLLNIYNGINFIYKGQLIIKNMSIVDCFKYDNNPKIFVNDINNLLLINWNEKRNIIFKTNHGNINSLVIYNTENCYQMIEKYCEIIGHKWLYRKDILQFIYKGKQIKYDPYTTIGQLFQCESNPEIFVNDIFDLLLINWDQTKNIVFIVNNNYKKEFTDKNTTSLDSVLGQFLYIINQTELKKNINDIKFLYKGQKIIFDPTTVGEFFLKDYNPVIYVIDIKNLIRPIDIIFKTSQGGIYNMSIYYKRTVGYLLMEYLDQIAHSELIDRNDIIFIYKTQQIKFWDKTNVSTLFLNDNNPIILVIDKNNILSNDKIQKIDVVFENSGRITYVRANFGTTIEQLIKKYLFKIGRFDLIENYYYNNNYIKIIYNASTYYFSEQKYVETIFSSNPSPKVLIYL